MEEIVNETLEPSVKRDFEMAQFEIIEFHTLFLILAFKRTNRTRCFLRGSGGL